MTDKKTTAKKYVICSKSGIGEIMEVTTLQEGGEKYYKVDFPKQNCINYFSVANPVNYRILSKKKDINEAIDIFKKKHKAIKYSSVQEKINSQKDLLKEIDICELSKTLSILNKESALHAQISGPYKSALKSFILEAEFVLKISKEEVCKLMGIKSPFKAEKSK